MCALLYAADGTPPPDDMPTAMLTGLGGLRLYKVSELPEPTRLRVLIQHARRRQSRGFVEVERTRFYPVKFRTFGLFPVAPIERCFLDAARHCRDLDVVRGLLIPNVQRGRVPLAALEEELERGTIAGSARPRRVINEIRAGAASVSEVPYVELFASSDILPQAHHNCALLSPDGEFLGRPDAYIEEAGLAGELQSLRYHLAPEAQTLDMAKREQRGRYGVQTFEIAPLELPTRGREHLAAIEDAYVLRTTQGFKPSVLVRCRPDCPLRERQLISSGSLY
jgi:hypothetical protein